MKLRKVFVILTLFLVIFLSGCVTKKTELTVPGPDVSIDEATEINLKILDLTKLTTGDTQEVLGYQLKHIEGAKVIEYRYTDNPIVVKIVKFNQLNDATGFWDSWIDYLTRNKQIVEQTELEQNTDSWEFKTLNYQILAWQEDFWFVYLEVPLEFKKSVELSYSVKDIINLHFENLNK